VDLYGNVSPSKDHWFNAGSGVAGVHYTMIFSKDEARAGELVFDGAKERNNSFFDHLLSKRTEIEQASGSSLDWRRMEDNKVSIIPT
jgi:hypothetical protein